MVCVVPSGSEAITGLSRGVHLCTWATNLRLLSHHILLAIYLCGANSANDLALLHYVPDAVSITALASLFICDSLPAAFLYSSINYQSSIIVSWSRISYSCSNYPHVFQSWRAPSRRYFPFLFLIPSYDEALNYKHFIFLYSSYVMSGFSLG